MIRCIVKVQVLMLWRFILIAKKNLIGQYHQIVIKEWKLAYTSAWQYIHYDIYEHCFVPMG